MSEARRTAFVAGDWTIEPELNLLRRADEERRIEPKVMKVLLTLASQHSHVFSKEALISAVWPDTFVSDDVLTRCISILRRITDDDPHAPHFIQTVPKVGYRLVAPIYELPLPIAPAIAQDEKIPELSSEASENIPLTKVAQNPTPAAPIPTSERTSPYKPWLIISLIAVVLVAGLVGMIRLWKTHTSSQDDAYFRTVPFTSFAGEQTEPAFSPDGQSIAFVRLAEDGNSRRIYIKRIGSESIQELTRGQDEQFSPAWSPDGRQIAYLARSENGLGLYIADIASSKPPRRVFIPQEPSHWEQGALSWSPDGKSLIFPDHMGTESNSSIFRLDLDHLRAQSITSPPAGWEGDLTPAYSPNGQYVAFSRASETAVRDIYWISLADGQLHQLTHDRMNIDGLAWSRDSSAILFSSNRGGKYSLWKIGIYGKEPVRLPVGTEDASQPTVGPHPGQLAYTQGSAIWGINRIASGEGSKEDAVLSSTQQDSAPSLSPDAKFFAFQSLRSGNQEIWIASVNGDVLCQLTSMNGPLTGSPSWSHKGDQILFDSRPDGHSHIFSIPAAGGHPTQITFGNVNDIIPRWSLDDQTVFFRSNRGGRWQIWKVSIHGGQPQPVTTDDGIVPQESSDGKWLYYTRGDESGLWRVPVSGGDETMVLPQPAAGYWGYWQVTPLGIFYLDTSHTPTTIRIFDPDSGQTRTFASLGQTPPQYQGISVTKDSKVLLITGKRNAERHITLVQDKP
jgi:Tol biopolymer transport system component/DNA-binding winged helix-turn-helix (wHTH) protein